jgi:glycosyltransferase involved in cell wall biosynthesis
MEKKNILISFVVPCYNSASYMNRCIDSLLVSKDDVEIIIVDDGSKDDTGKIADTYEKRYPQTIRAVHKENGGHGSGVNTGLKLAKGEYFKVVDSDDWLDETSLHTLIKKIKEVNKNKQNVDLFINNYVYDHLYEHKQKTINFSNVFPENKLFTWEDTGHFRSSQYIIMHSLVYKTEVLRAAKLMLPEHTFYADNIVAYQPLPYVKTMCYLNIDLYHYFIGRADQSVNEKVMMGRVDQQIRVTKLIIDAVNLNKLTSKKLKNYLIKYISMMLVITEIYLLMIGDEVSLNKKNDIWLYIKQKDPNLYNVLMHKTLSGLCKGYGKISNYIILKGYQGARYLFKFN